MLEEQYDFHGVGIGSEAFLTREGEGEVSDPPNVRSVMRRVVSFHASLHQLLCFSHSALHFTLQTKQHGPLRKIQIPATDFDFISGNFCKDVLH